MTTDILEQHDPLGRAFLIALALHGALLGWMLFSALFVRHKDSFGAPDAGGMAIGVEAVNSIPLVHHGQTNPLTNDTQSEVPQQPVTKPKDQVKDEKIPPNAVRLKTRTAKKAALEASVRQKFRPISELQPNQLTSTTAPQVSAPEFAAAPGSGRIGAGAKTLLGNMLPGYAAQIQEILSRNWHTSEVDARIRTAMPVIATFDLMRDGSVRNVQLLQRTGIAPLDSSVQRAILDSKFPPIPPSFPRDHASVEFSFELQR